MEGFIVLVYIIILVWGVLNIVLFFKIWGMTNDVNDIKEFIIKRERFSNKDEIHPQKTEDNDIREETDLSKQEEDGLKVGDRVKHEIYNKDKIMIIGNINADGSCLCMDEIGNAYGTYSADKLTKI